MPWGALISVGAGLLLGNKGRKKQDESMQAQIALGREQIGLGREYLQFGKRQYRDWKARDDEIFGMLMGNIDSDLRPDYDAIAGDVKSSFHSARGIEMRRRQRYGIDPRDGSFGRMERDYATREAAAHVGARSHAREGKRGLKYNRIAQLYGVNTSGRAAATAGVAGGYNATMNAMGNLGNVYGNNAAIYGNQAYGDAAGIGAAIGGIDWGGIWGDVQGWFADSDAGGGAPVPA